jgi:hypothetical protein
MGLFIYILGMAIAFVVSILLLYRMYKDKYYTTPSLKGVLRTLERKDLLEIYVCGVIVYPLAIVVLIGIWICKSIGKLFTTLVDSTFIRTKDYKLKQAKIALLKVGDRIPYIQYLNTSVKPNMAVIRNVTEDMIKIEYTQRTREIRKKDIILYKGDLLVDLYED